MRGLKAAIAAKADEIAIFASASEGFSKANLNCSIDESFDRFVPVAEAAREAGLPVRGYVSCVTDCPYDGQIDPAAAARVVERLVTLGCYEVSLGDTIGQAQPERLATMLDAVLAVIPAGKLAGHYHDTAGRALRNIEVSLDKGLRVFDAAVGGLGGCPYAPGAAGNVATETVHRRLTELGLSTGLDPVILDKAAAFARQIRGASDA
jgi:hydroxymethylglutaryl-CoA lyase